MAAREQRWRERLEQELPLVLKTFPSATLDLEAGVVIVKGHMLPPGWSHGETDVLVEIPPKYPTAHPENLCVRADLTLGGGRRPEKTMGQRDIVGRPWLQFSYHINGADWRPDGDVERSSTLVDYLHGALSRFEEAT